MTSQQIDTAMRSRCPVVYNGITYRRVTEYISWYDNRGEHQLSAVEMGAETALRLLRTGRHDGEPL